MITYKLVRCRRGLYYPLFVETDRSMPLGNWLDAQIGELLDPTHVRSPVLGRLALRPGWHSCTVPFTDWIGKKGEDGRLLQRPDTVWIECEVEGDEQIVTDRRGLRSLPHGWYRFYQPSIALSTQKKDLWTPCSAAVECPEKGE